MARFKKPDDYPRMQPSPEAAITGPEERPEGAMGLEAAVAGSEEMPAGGPAERATPQRRICGIGGCRTWYDDPVVMERHRQREHGLRGAPNLNQPKPRNPDSPGDPLLRAMKEDRI